MRLRILLLLGAALLAALALASVRPGSVDDLFILLVYARRLAGGEGFHFNLGEPPVDGFTSTLDLLLKALGLRLFPADPVRVAWAATTLCYFAAVAAAVAVALRITRAGDRGPVEDAGDRPSPVGPLAAVGALALALTPGLAEGTSYLLGTPLFALTILLAVRVVVYGAGRGVGASLGRGGVLLLLVLARPEGLALAVPLLAWRWCSDAREQRGWERSAGALLFLLAVAAYAAWRLATFGHLAPNSYYAKTSSVRWNEIRDGLAYVDAFTRGVGAPHPVVAAIVGGALLLNLAAAPLLLLRGRWSAADARRRYGILSGMGLVALGVVVWSGGDCYQGARFLVPALPLSLCAALEGSVHLRAPECRWLAALPLVVLAGQLRVVLPDAPAKLRAVFGAPPSEEDYDCSRRIALRLAAAVPGARVAQHDFQRFKYFSDATQVMDTTGINHAGIAHEAERGPVRFGRDGLLRAVREGYEIVHVDYRWTRPTPMAEHTVSRVFGDPTLSESFFGEPFERPEAARALEGAYRTATLPDVCGAGTYFNLFVRADLAASFRAAGFLVGPP